MLVVGLASSSPVNRHHAGWPLVLEDPEANVESTVEDGGIMNDVVMLTPASTRERLTTLGTVPTELSAGGDGMVAARLDAAALEGAIDL